VPPPFYRVRRLSPERSKRSRWGPVFLKELTGDNAKELEAKDMYPETET